MVNPELVSYIWNERKKKVSDYIILANFIAQGWSEEDFRECVATLPPPHTIEEKPSSENMIAGTDLRKLGQGTVWRTSDGKTDKPFVPLYLRHKKLFKALLVLLVGIGANGAVYIYRESVGPFVLKYYDIAEPYYVEAIQVLKFATDFSRK